MPAQQKNRVFAAISYLWLLVLIPLLYKRDNEFIMHHARQGLVLLIASFFATLIGWIPFLGYYMSMLAGIGLAILGILGIINALDGQKWEMPVLGKYAKKIKL
jgi:uncharacterized membrane protein